MKTFDFRIFFLAWYYENRRDLPWRSNINVYNVWIAEIIFQQTRINQGLWYYNRFTERFPDVESLAQSTEDEVLKMWQGLGYYSRARNLLSTAKKIVNEYGGIFPTTYAEIKKLKGVGDYTAAAIASVVYGEPVPAIDGNGLRVLSRLFAIDQPVDSSKGKKMILDIASELIDPNQPGDFNQAVIEFGALHCTPRQPKCHECPFSNDCLAYTAKKVELFPLKLKRTKTIDRFFNYFIVDLGDTILFNKRGDRDIWKNLYDFPLIESESEVLPEEFVGSDEWRHFFGDTSVTIVSISEKVLHQLSHQRILARFYRVGIQGNKNFGDEYMAVDKKDIFALPVPKIIENSLTKMFVE